MSVLTDEWKLRVALLSTPEELKKRVARGRARYLMIKHYGRKALEPNPTLDAIKKLADEPVQWAKPPETKP